MSDYSLPTKLYFDLPYYEYSNLVRENKVIFITDENLFSLYSDFFEDKIVIKIPVGERSKSLSQLEIVISELLYNSALRDTFLIGFGGGVVSDVTGFVASIFMRGIKFGFISTSLLSQIDASLGGKNGINFLNKKNIIGTFSHPEFVIYDSDLLKTLPKIEIKNGLAELIKMFLLFDKEMINFCLQNPAKLLSIDSDFFKEAIKKAVLLKKKIVEEDVFDNGKRNLLNFGHTFGHIIESEYNLRHGEAVCIGMVIACEISVKLGYLSQNDFQRIISLLKKLSLPVNFDFSKELLMKNLRFDKKNFMDGVNIILLKEIGNPIIRKLSHGDIKELL